MNKLLAAKQLSSEYPLKATSEHKIKTHREEISKILSGEDDRVLVITGPCSIHDIESAKEYATLLRGLAEKYSDIFKFVMRVYLEKPRTSTGWKGFLHEPNVADLTEADIALGLKESRKLLIDLADLGVACATEILDPLTTPVYLSELYSLCAIGARTTESQVHRELASGFSCPVGFKNSTDGHVLPAINGIRAAEDSHTFLSIDSTGYVESVTTKGNPDCFLILRGSNQCGNFYHEDISLVSQTLDIEGHGDTALVVDCSHGNALGDYSKQPLVFKNVIEQICDGNQRVRGLMLESHLVEGSQKIKQGDLNLNVDPWQSVTDGCVSWQVTVELIEEMHGLLEKRPKRRRLKNLVLSGPVEQLGNDLP